jgi:flagella basal body P-ring formation protein FlgA
MMRATLILAAVLLCRPAAADEVVLRGSVRLAPSAQAIRLADIADITGPEAQRYADAVVAQVSDQADVQELSVQQVRDALTAAGVHWGKVQLSGRVVIVRPAPQAGASQPRLMAPALINGGASAAPAPAAPAEAWEAGESLADLPTVRGAITRSLLSALGVPPQRLRLTFESGDSALLDTKLESGQFEIQPLSNLDGDRVEICLRTWSAGRIEQQHNLTVRPMVRSEAAVLRRDVNRGEMVHEQDCQVEPRWVSPLQASTLSGLVESVGRVADMPLKAGDVLKKKHFKREVLIRRGERVTVRCLVGGAVISLDAEARGDGAEGERIELRKVGERDTFFGTVAGPGSAIVDLAR